MSDQFMTCDKQGVLLIIPQEESQVLSPTQRKFNAALKKIDKQKQSLQEWQKAHEACQQILASSFNPLRLELVEAQYQLVLLLDGYVTSHKFTKQQEEKLFYLIRDLCDQIEGDIDTAEFLDLQQRYREEEPTAEELAEAEQEMRDFIQASFGISLDEHVDIRDPDAVAAYLFEHSQQHEEQATQHQHHASSRKKTAKQLAKEAKEHAEAEAAQQTIQSIYRQLVKNLHPDRETDHAEKDRKTLLMQEITVAYEEKNLIRLLELQLQEIQLEQSLHQLPEDKIKPFLRLLEDQWQQLKEETQQIELRYKQIVGLASFERLTPKQLNGYLKEDIAQLKRKIQQIKSDHQAFERDVKHLKGALKYLLLPE